MAIFIGIYHRSIFNSHYMTPDIRNFFYGTEFSLGQCLKSPKYWGVNPKKIIGHKIINNQTFFLLKDIDKYEHLQYFSHSQLKLTSFTVNCPHD